MNQENSEFIVKELQKVRSSLALDEWRDARI